MDFQRWLDDFYKYFYGSLRQKIYQGYTLSTRSSNQYKSQTLPKKIVEKIVAIKK